MPWPAARPNTVERREMLASANCRVSPHYHHHHPSHLFRQRSGRKFTPKSSKKENFSENSGDQDPIAPLRAPKALLARSAIAVLGLGFIDAGYSGDWSRIGVITKETEDLLKLAAYLVAPLCLFLIISISDDKQ